MNITIGDKTKNAMKILGIDSFPFTRSELKSKFRDLAKNHHPDKLNGDSSLMKQINSAYTHIKYLAIEDNEIKGKGESILKAERENEDIFDLFDNCKKCKGKGKIINNYPSTVEQCDRCSISTRIFYGYYERFPTGKIKVVCKSCKGSGKFKQKRSKKIVDCFRCKGKGYKYIVCPKCKGERYINVKSYTTESPCHICGGSGGIKLNPFNPVIPKGAIL